MENALIALVAMIIFTIVVYVGSWLNGTTLTRTFTKWYFIVMLIATVIVTIVTLVLSSGE
ncbi:hypothetical protein [Paenibacillus sp. NEAU-GSW1]|uniref:hypothetical protein n=1 Tax=Paenibacillus sp. NEAU-GSW1 TaxID=2682486 RepID=UPI0012E119E0|nr:hypothetical protein [Paenibacillus sp. NEAU-GSW1]MUT68595.1 hypothetical protein [Paenibacillus sp. NEAU-GSW1]